ncbi:hypothetical protein FRB90_010113, partial [Tulasnella sp. 427]
MATTTVPERHDSAYDTKEKDSIEQIERNLQHPAIIVDEKVHDPGARFAAAKIAGKLDPWSRASFTIYACAFMA